MNVSHLELRDFRSYPALRIDFADKVNLISGANGAGKSNLAEAIYFLSLAKSWRSDDLAPLVRDGAESAYLSAQVQEGVLSRQIEIVITAKGRKISINGKPAYRLSELSRLVNVVLFTPDDTSLFAGPPLARRSFLDVNLAKQSLDYFALIGKYDRLLAERNAVLKKDKPDRNHLAALTDQMIAVSEPISRYRRLYVDKLNGALLDLSASLFGSKREALIAYEPFILAKEGSWRQAAEKAYAKSLDSDLIRKSTGVGVHREDYRLLLDGKDIAVYGSEGENRLAAIALKLAPYFLVEEEAKRPIVVLDDVYSELDSDHAARLTDLISRMGQTFVTATQLRIDGASEIEVADHKAARRS